MIKGTIFSLLFCTMAQSLRMRMDLNTKQYISKYKDFLKTENYDDLLQDIKQNKVSKLYISDTYQEVVSEHKGEENDLPEDIDFINNGRTTKINPIFVQNLIDKSTETKTSIEVVDFRPDYMINFNNGFEVLSNTISILIPIYLIATFLSFLSRNPMTNGFRNNNMKSNMMPGQLDFFNNRNNNDNENTIQENRRRDAQRYIIGRTPGHRKNAFGESDCLPDEFDLSNDVRFGICRTLCRYGRIQSPRTIPKCKKQPAMHYIY